MEILVDVNIFVDMEELIDFEELANNERLTDKKHKRRARLITQKIESHFFTQVIVKYYNFLKY